MSYVPPALRRKQQEASKGEKGVEREVAPTHGVDGKPSIHSLKDIQKHFWPTWTAETPVLDSNSKDDRATEGYVGPGQEKHPQPGANDASPDNNEGSDTAAWLAPSTKSDAPASEVATESETDGKSPQQIVSRETGRSSSNSETLASQPASSDRGKQELINSVDSVSKESVQYSLTEKERSTRRSNSFILESVHPHNTLNSTEEAPDTLQYVLLFHDANPRWLTDNIIFVKSALDLLPTQDDEKQKETRGGPAAKHIMIFEQQNTHKTVSNAMFTFIGYFNLVNMQILEPQTSELVRMQEQKWTRTDKFGRARPINRNAESWKKSLTQRWAVLKFEKDDTFGKDMQPPQIKTSSHQREDNEVSGQHGKSVNEMLKEMRMQDSI